MPISPYDSSSAYNMSSHSQQTERSYYEPLEDGFQYPKKSLENPYNPLQDYRRDRVINRERLMMLRQDHARQRAMMAQRLGMMPRVDMMGGLTAPDFYDDGIINGSGMMYDSLYDVKKLPVGQMKF